MVGITMIEVSLRFGLSEELARETPYADAFKVCVHLPALCPQKPCSAENVILVSTAENENDQSLTFRCTQHNCEFTLANSLFGKLLMSCFFKQLFDSYVDGHTTLQQLSAEICRDPAQLTRYVDELAAEVSARLPQAPRTTCHTSNCYSEFQRVYYRKRPSRCHLQQKFPSCHQNLPSHTK